MPGYDESSLASLEAYVGTLSHDQALGVVGALHALRVRMFGAGSPGRLAAALERLASGGPLDRQLLATGLLPVKVTHFARDDVYRAMNVSRPAAPSARARPTRGVIGPSDLRDLSELTLDVIVVGSGAGGAVVAHELAIRGASVLIVEEGGWFTRSDFGGAALETTTRMYRNAGLTFTLGTPPIFLPVGRTVGGTTTINSGTCYRAPDRVLERWVSMGLGDFAPKRLEGHFEAVESVLGVAEAQASYLGEGARLIAQGCDILGYRHAPLRRNAPDCDGQGRCALGCPTDAKRSTNVSYVPLALARGASIAPSTKLVSLARSGARVTSAVVEHSPTRSRYTLHAKSVVISAGALRTPLILKAAGIRSPLLGRNLSIHPAAAAYAGFDRSLDPMRAIPQSYSIEAFHEAGLLFEGGTVPPELAAGAFPLLGPELQDTMEAFDRTASFGFLIEDEGHGRVLGEYKELPLVRYELSDRDVRRIQRGLEILVGIYLAAGARWVRPLLTFDRVIRSFDELRAFSGEQLTRSSLQLTAYHPLGTARASISPADGVAGPDGRVHGTENLFVADGSVLPTSPAVNPQVTIMAVARHIAERLADRVASSS
ncbi:MAG: GMC family oxidoreductase [Deltaproteobacteria bacterium]|nr:GMC family oxidoreductase [Deltaproteobacteria bacterium]